AGTEALLHAFRIAADAVVGPLREPDDAERVLDLTVPRGAIEADELAVHAKHLARAQPVLVAEELGEVSDPAPRALVRGTVGQRSAEDPALAGRRPREAEE